MRQSEDNPVYLQVIKNEAKWGGKCFRTRYNEDLYGKESNYNKAK